MSTNHHTPHPFLGPVTSPEFNSRLGELDAAINLIMAAGLVEAATTLDAQALAGQPVLPVASTDGFIVGDAVWVGTPGSGIQETGVVASISAGVSITLTANLTSTHAIGTPVSRSPVEIVDARGTDTTLGGRIGRIDGRVFDVARYGSVQAAIDAAGGAGGGVVLLAPSTVYSVGPLTMPSPNVTLRGSGKSSVLRYNGASAGKLIHATADYCRVEDLTVEDNGISSTALVSMNLLGTAQIKEPVVRGVRAVCTNAGSRGIVVGWSSDAVVDDCFAQNLAATVANTETFGVYIHSASPNDTTDAVVRNCRIDGFYYGIASNGTGTRKRLVIDGNVVKNSINVGIWGYHGEDSRIVNNTVESTGQGIFADTPNVVAHNRVYNCPNGGIRLEQLQYGTVADNTVESCGVAGIVIGGGSFHATVSGNSLASNQIGILVDRFLTPITNSIYELHITNNYIRWSTSHGIQLMGVYRSCTVDGNVITDNNLGLAASGSGIRIQVDSGGSNCRNVFIRNNTIGNNMSAPSGGGVAGDQRYGLNILDASAGYVLVSGNIFRGNVTGGIVNVGVATPAMDILGNILQAGDVFTTPSINRHGDNIGGLGMTLTTRGTAGSVAATTTVDVVVTWPNGGFPDTNYNVSLTARSGTVASIAQWVKAKTATTCTVAIRNASGTAGNIDFDIIGVAAVV